MINNKFSEKLSDEEKLNGALDLMTSAEIDIDTMFQGIKGVIVSTKSHLNDLKKEKSKLEEKHKEDKLKISGLNVDQAKILKEYSQIKEELEKFTKQASGADGFDVGDINATLAIYRVLLEEIWQSQPHFLVLKVLHGDAEVMDVQKIKSATGIAGAMVLRACHELTRAGLIEFDIETKEAKLKKRLFKKKEH